MSNATDAPRTPTWVEAEVSHEKAQIPISVIATAGANRVAAGGLAAGLPAHELDDTTAKVKYNRR